VLTASHPLLQLLPPVSLPDCLWKGAEGKEYENDIMRVNAGNEAGRVISYQQLMPKTYQRVATDFYGYCMLRHPSPSVERRAA
jgi:hypothetical protein